MKIKGPRPRSFSSYDDFDGVGGDLVVVEGMQCSIPSTLLSWVETVKKVIPNFSIHYIIHHLVLSPILGHLCCVVREMASTIVGALYDGLLFKWFDLIQDASRQRFDTTWLLDHVDSLARSYVHTLSACAGYIVKVHKLNEDLLKLYNTQQELSRKLASVNESIEKLEAKKKSLEGSVGEHESAGLRV